MDNVRVHALVPVKDLGLAKTRLAAVLTAEERRDLARAMLEDVLAALLASPGVGAITLLSDDPVADRLARGHGVGRLGEHALGAAGLNPVIAAAVAALRSRDNRRILVLHSDLPYLRADDIAGVLDLLMQSGGLVIGPDQARAGTNLLAFGSGCVPRFSFGSRSYAHHCNWARAGGVMFASFESRGVAVDIDTPADLAGLLDGAVCRPGSNTEGLVRGWQNDRIIQIHRRLSEDSGHRVGALHRSTGGGSAADAPPG